MKTTKIGSLAFAFALLAMAAPAFAENDLPADHFSYGLSKEASQWHSSGGKNKMVMSDTTLTFQTGDAPAPVLAQREQVEPRAARVEPSRSSASPATTTTR